MYGNGSVKIHSLDSLHTTRLTLSVGGTYDEYCFEPGGKRNMGLGYGVVVLSIA
jgi:hypothetical protein